MPVPRRSCPRPLPSSSASGRYRHSVERRIAVGPRRRTASIGQLTWLLLRDPDDLDPAECTALTELRTTSPVIERTYVLSQAFQRLLRQRTPDALEDWFAQAASAIPDLQTFAEGLS